MTTIHGALFPLAFASVQQQLGEGLTSRLPIVRIAPGEDETVLDEDWYLVPVDCLLDAAYQPHRERIVAFSVASPLPGGDPSSIKRLSETIVERTVYRPEEESP